MLTLDAPSFAVAIWQEGTKWLIRFPDAQLIDIPAGSVQRLAQILASREAKGANGKMTLNSMSLPTQEILDSWTNRSDPGFHEETWDERIERAGARRRAKEEKQKLRDIERKRRIAAERRKLADAEELLQELNL